MALIFDFVNYFYFKAFIFVDLLILVKAYKQSKLLFLSFSSFKSKISYLGNDF